MPAEFGGEALCFTFFGRTPLGLSFKTNICAVDGAGPKFDEKGAISYDFVATC